jgi:hypothetical protein
MKTTAKVGGILELEILRANGDVEYIGKIHNILGAAVLPSDRVPFSGPSSANNGVPYFYTQSSFGTEDLPGTFSQTGTTVTRESGAYVVSDLTDGDIIQFATGEWAYVTSSALAASCTVSKSQNVATTTAKRYRTNTSGFGANANTGSIQAAIGGIYGVNSAYSNGVFTNTMVAPRAFPTVVTPYTLRCISAGIYMSSQALSYASYYDLPSPLSLLAGDTIIIKSWVHTITLNEYLPIEFAVSPMNGLSGSGRYQSLHPMGNNIEASNGSPRIWLVSDANKIVIPNRLTYNASYLLPATFTPIETLVAVSVNTPPSFSNNATETAFLIAASTIGGTVKQIIWGSSTQLYGVIEFDTPVVIAPDKAITIVATSVMEPELP